MEVHLLFGIKFDILNRLGENSPISENLVYGLWRSFWKLQRHMRGCPKFNLQSPIWILTSVWKLQRFVRVCPKSNLQSPIWILTSVWKLQCFVRGCPKSNLQTQTRMLMSVWNYKAICVGVQNPISPIFRIKIGGKIHGPTTTWTSWYRERVLEHLPTILLPFCY